MRPRSKQGCARWLALTAWFVTGLGLGLTAGCGSELGSADPLNLATWISGNGLPPEEGDGDATTGGGTGGPGLLGFWAATGAVAGEVELRDGSGFELSGAALDFGESTTVRAFYVINAGPEILHYTVQSDVAWATVSPTGGTNAGGQDRIEVRVHRGGLPKGPYAGRITVTAEGAGSEEVAVSMTVGAGQLAVSTFLVDFGANALTRGLTLWNDGGGTLAYTIDTNVDWLTVKPSGGQLATEVDEIEVTIRRGAMVTGAHQAQLTIRAGTGEPVRVVVVAQKPVTTPLIVPWIEVNNELPSEIEACVEALQVYRRVTDTAVVSTSPGHATLYPTLRSRLPDMQIIPGMKTWVRLGRDSFDSVAGWQLVADDVRQIIATSGMNVVVIENETAIKSYIEGAYNIDLQRLRKGLAYLPTDVQYIWYPVHMSNAEQRERMIPIIHLLQDRLNVRLVDHSQGAPGWQLGEGRQILETIAVNPTVPILWWGCFTNQHCYWGYNQVEEAMQRFAGRLEILVYADAHKWTEVADAFVATLSP